MKPHHVLLGASAFASDAPRPRARLRAVFPALLGLMLVSGCAALLDDQDAQSNEVALSPMAIVVAPTKVQSAAEAFAARHPPAFVFLGDSEDLVPRYVSGTVLIVEPGDYKSLARGATVVFRSPENGPVVRMLTRKTSAGWLTRGFRSRKEDTLLVTEGTYLGTVVIAFSPDATGTAPKP